MRARLTQVLRAALAAVDAGDAVRRALRDPANPVGVGRATSAVAPTVWVLAAGKAAGPMSAACEAVLGARVAGGLAVTKDGHGVPLQRIELREAGHPVPDERSERCAREARSLVARAGRDEALLVLLSGGASSLLACPAPGLSLQDVAACTAGLLAAGADIEEMNAVRKHLSAVAGGQLALAARSERIDVLAISDVPGDRLDVIGSGPFCGDPSTFAQARAVLERRQLWERIPPRVATHLRAGEHGRVPETPKPGSAALSRVHTRLLATNATAMEAAAVAAARVGWRPLCLPGVLRGEARDAGRRLAGLAQAIRASPRATGVVCLIAGGETVVTVRGNGRGGRNQELALAAACTLRGTPGVSVLAAGTDGGDGPTDAAGAFADGETVGRGRAAGVDAATALATNDSNGFFRAEGGVLVTGPTGTNVMDLALVVVDAGGD